MGCGVLLWNTASPTDSILFCCETLHHQQTRPRDVSFAACKTNDPTWSNVYKSNMRLNLPCKWCPLAFLVWFLNLLCFTRPGGLEGPPPTCDQWVKPSSGPRSARSRKCLLQHQLLLADVVLLAAASSAPQPPYCMSIKVIDNTPSSKPPPSPSNAPSKWGTALLWSVVLCSNWQEDCQSVPQWGVVFCCETLHHHQQTRSRDVSFAACKTNDPTWSNGPTIMLIQWSNYHANPMVQLSC